MAAFRLMPSNNERTLEDPPCALPRRIQRGWEKLDSRGRMV